MQIPFFGTSTKVFSLSGPFIFSLFQIWVCTCPNLGSSSTTEIDMHQPDSMVLLAAGVCGGIAVFVVVAHWLGVSREFFGLNFIFVCVGCYVWLPRNSNKIWEVVVVVVVVVVVCLFVCLFLFLCFFFLFFVFVFF